MTRIPRMAAARHSSGRHDPMPPGIDMPFDERAFRHGVLRQSLGRFAESLLDGSPATLVVASHARHYTMGDDPELVIDAIRGVSTAAAARRGPKH